MRFRVLVPALVVLCASFSSTVLAAPFVAGDFTTFSQDDFGNPAQAGGQLVIANYDVVYATAGGIVEVGIPGAGGLSLLFTNRNAVTDYLPAIGNIGPLTTDLVDPSASASGDFGGEVLALRLNIDFSDAGFTLGPSAVPFGDLLLANMTTVPQLNGLTVRQFSALVNTLLGGGSGTYSIDELDPIANQLNYSFREGVPDTFAQEHLLASGLATAVPEPASLMLLAVGLVGIAISRWRDCN